MAPHQSPRRHKHRRSRPRSGESAEEPLRSPRRRSGERRDSRYYEEERETASHEKRKSYSPEKRRTADAEKRDSGYSDKRRSKQSSRHKYAQSSSGSSAPLSLDALAKLDAQVERQEARQYARQAEREKEKEKVVTGRVVKDRRKHHRHRSEHDGRRHRVREAASTVSSVLEKPFRRKRRDEYDDYDEKYTRYSTGGGKSKKKMWISLGIAAVIFIVAVSVGVVVAGKKNTAANADSGSGNSPISGVNQDSIPSWARGGVLDPFTWYDTNDFNLTFTNDTVGGLSIMGLNSTWDDSTQANEYVPPLNSSWAYGEMPIRGINVGGWLSLEPFITPSLFNAYDTRLGIIDEWTLTTHLGTTQAAQTLEKHYATFINRASFAAMRDAGFDHVRIPYSYWALTTYPGDPYVPKISWRYLLRAIEYCRQMGMRVNLDLHALPGSQNGWNHSGRQGPIGWLNGTDGSLNAQRSLDLHSQLATFFSQPRYRNVVTIYGLVNEPKMIALPTQAVLDWTTQAISLVRKNGFNNTIVFGDGFLGLPNWQGKLQGISNIVMDAHNYVIFNNAQIAFSHQVKLNYACSGWQGQMRMSINTASGFGPTLCGEWSQADTDCAPYLNNVGAGTRWTGTYVSDTNPALSKLTPGCPASSPACDCAPANADPSTYTPLYKQWLRMNAEAQMTSFEVGWGWFYWTWLTEGSTQWSWKLGMEAGILPGKVWDRGFNCTEVVPDFKGLPETY